MLRRRRALTVVLLGVALAACRAEPPSHSTARDSAGIRIVESSAPAWSADESWTVDSLPSLSIGTVNGAPELSLARVSGVNRLADGRIVVADEGSHELRIFDGTGAFVKRLGRQGSGPGEFVGLQGVGVTGDSVWVYDPRARRLSFVDVENGGFRTLAIPTGNTFPGIVGRRANGSFVFASEVSPGIDKIPKGVYRPSAIYFSISADGASTDTIARGQGTEMILMFASKERIEILRPLFNHSSSRAVGGDQLFYSDQDRYEIRAYDANDSLRSIVRRPDIDLTLDDKTYAAEIERQVSTAPAESQPRLRQSYGEQTKPATRPAFGRLLVDADANLWVQDYSNDASNPAWAIFDPEGTWLGNVQLPLRFRPFEIDGSEVLGVWRDDLDVEYVRAYALRKGER